MGKLKHRRPVIAPNPTTGAMGNVGGGMTSYSTTEQNTGATWTNGKPIYQKTVSGTFAVGSPTTLAHGIADIDRIVKLESISERTTDQWFTLDHGHPSVIGELVLLTVDKTNIRLDDAGAVNDNEPFDVTIWYTKTTD